jgi:hypothetical protein
MDDFDRNAATDSPSDATDLTSEGEQQQQVTNINGA